jgi:hypothetical protein
MGCQPAMSKIYLKDFLKCPQNHALKKTKKSNSHQYCSVCSNGIQDVFMYCKICGYKLCKLCWGKIAWNTSINYNNLGVISFALFIYYILYLIFIINLINK